MNTNSMLSRIEALEAQTPKKSARYLDVISDAGETPQQAEARVRRERGLPHELHNLTGSKGPDIRIWIC